MRGGAKSIYYLEPGPYKPFAGDYPAPERTLRVLSWIDGQVSRLWFRPWLYFFSGCALLPLALVRYLRGAPALPLMLALSGFLYMCSLFVATGSDDYRYTVWTTSSTLLAIIAAAASAYATRRVRGGAARVIAPDGPALGARPVRRAEYSPAE
jgi:hypothetical protein